jgi:hypothetical protein
LLASAVASNSPPSGGYVAWDASLEAGNSLSEICQNSHLVTWLESDLRISLRYSPLPYIVELQVPLAVKLEESHVFVALIRIQQGFASKNVGSV